METLRFTSIFWAYLCVCDDASLFCHRNVQTCRIDLRCWLDSELAGYVVEASRLGWGTRYRGLRGLGSRVGLVAWSSWNFDCGDTWRFMGSYKLKVR